MVDRGERVLARILRLPLPLLEGILSLKGAKRPGSIEFSYYRYEVLHPGLIEPMLGRKGMKGSL